MTQLLGQITRLDEEEKNPSDTRNAPDVIEKALFDARVVMLTGEVNDMVARRMTEQQELIATLLTSNSECRLANTLLIMGRRSNRRDASGRLVAPDLRQGELAAMVGTTRTRIGMFLKKFRRLGLIHPHTPGTLAVAEERMRTFIDYAGSDPGGGASSCPGRGPAQGASAGSLA